MSDFRINDEWILSRISGQSTSFSQWLSSLMNSVEQSLKEIHPEALEEVKKHVDLLQFKDLDKDLSAAQEELDKLGFFGKKMSSFTADILSGFQKPIEKRIKKSLKNVEGLDLDLDFITGKKKDLSTALFEVSKERGIESEGLLYLIRALPDLEAFLYSTSVKKYYRDHTEHALRVAVLGDFLLEQDFGKGSLDGLISELTELDKNLLKEKFWWIIAHEIFLPAPKVHICILKKLISILTGF